MAYHGQFRFVVLSFFLCAGSVLADSSHSQVSPAIAKERRQYILTGVDDLNSRAKHLRKVVAYRRAACALLHQTPPGSQSTAIDCDSTASLAAAEEAISSAIASLKSARHELKGRDFDASETYLITALRHLSEAWELLTTPNDCAESLLACEKLHKE